ncbi:16S rRNA (uracil(1498)-N(3))-methyltransferase [Actinotalea sp. C106]|uniref:16S rRNA (uracil(1498)-N(3))-methyltransferase n=1 Tax=Actinotalea sp. C106 TaxID=2908644 RepID=UPI002027EC58|nr:16S rRNA (uracil(1498)-N(3))-methyltransferase [Actinotalea sp. C106]
MSAPVFLDEPGNLDEYVAGSTYLLCGTEGRHAGVVQRRGPGERIDVVDGAGVRLRCQILAVAAGGLELDVVERVDEPAPEVRLVLVQALAKGQRDEMAVESATEIGVDVVVPWQADRSIVVWRGDRVAKNRARWAACLRAAAKQSRRARVPDLVPAQDGPGLVRLVREVLTEGGAALVLDQAGSVPVADVGLPSAGGARVLVVVGPEGGVSEREVASLTEAGAQVVRLGPHVLRSSTAGPVAVAVLAQRLGRWT